jgi:hypothetical protein
MPAGMPYARGKGQNKNLKVGMRAVRDYKDQPLTEELQEKNTKKDLSKKSKALKKAAIGNPGRAMVHSFYGSTGRKSTSIEDRRNWEMVEKVPVTSPKKRPKKTLRPMPRKGK